VLISGILDDANPYCVYYHLADRTLFYIGSGVLARAFDHGSARRNEAWNRFVDGRRVSVQIVSQHAERATARREEYAAIKAHRPVANLPYDPALPLEWQERQGEGIPWVVATDAFTGTRIRMTDADGKFRHFFGDLQTAASMMGLTKGAICNSIAGRYPVVGGFRFFKEPRPATGLVWSEDERRSLIQKENPPTPLPPLP
jgi:hypothetical protein